MAGPQVNVRITVRAIGLATAEARTKAIDNVYDFRRTTTGGSPVKTQIITAFKTLILTPLANCLSVSYVKQFIDIRFLDDVKDPVLTVADGVNGAVAGDSLPTLNNVLMQLKTGVRGRRYRGFKFYGPIAESHTLLDYLTGAAITLWATFQTAYLAGFTDASGFVWQPYLVSPKSSNLKTDPPIIVGNIINGTQVNAQLTKKTTRWQGRRSAA